MKHYLGQQIQRDTILRWAVASSPNRTASSLSKQSSANNDHHLPPLLGRIALVSSTTALATPAFPALGFLYAVLRVTIPDANLRKVMEGRWGAVVSFTTWTLLPNLYHGAVTSMILPCALGNALVAGCTYGLVDVISGGPKGSNSALLQKPWITGAGIGATVGFVAPIKVWGPIMEYCWGLEGMTQSMKYVMSIPFATEVSVATGIVAGTILHPLLYYPVHGIKGVHWGFPLAAVMSALYYIYYGRDESGLPVPEGSYIEPSQLDMVDSILRYNNSSGLIETYSLKSEQFIGSPEKFFQGQKIAESSRAYASSGDNVVFDDRMLAFVYNYWDIKTASRFPDHVVSNIPSASSLQHTQDSMIFTDALVASILHKSDFETIKSAVDDIVDRSAGKKRPLTDLKSFQKLKFALELLMLLQQNANGDSLLNKQYANEIPKLERYVRRMLPTVVLYTNDEQYKGESVESQLKSANWKGQMYRMPWKNGVIFKKSHTKLGGIERCLLLASLFHLEVRY
jgi:hypothetical protein